MQGTTLFYSVKTAKKIRSQYFIIDVPITFATLIKSKVINLYFIYRLVGKNYDKFFKKNMLIFRLKSETYPMNLFIIWSIKFLILILILLFNKYF